MQQFQFTIEYVKLNLPFRQFLTLITMEEIIYRNYFTHSGAAICHPSFATVYFSFFFITLIRLETLG